MNASRRQRGLGRGLIVHDETKRYCSFPRCNGVLCTRTHRSNRTVKSLVKSKRKYVGVGASIREYLRPITISPASFSSYDKFSGYSISILIELWLVSLREWKIRCYRKSESTERTEVNEMAECLMKLSISMILSKFILIKKYDIFDTIYLKSSWNKFAIVATNIVATI